MKNDMGTSFNQDIPTSLSLIDSLIKPILLYASDFWGCLKLPKNNPIENLHMMMCKQMLGVQKQTTNIGVLLELGRTPLSLWATKYAIKNWERIHLGQDNEILINGYNESDMSWGTRIRATLELNDMLNFFDSESNSNYPFVYLKVFKKIYDDFHQTSFDGIKRDESKLRTYSLFKTEIGLERYLLETKNVIERVATTKFRLSNHKLMIEVGRHDDTPRERRFCPFCPQAIENESHFMFSCQTYSHLRERYLRPKTNNIQNFQFLPHDAKLQALLSDIDRGTTKYISKSMELRAFLISKPRRQD